MKSKEYTHTTQLTPKIQTQTEELNTNTTLHPNLKPHKDIKVPIVKPKEKDEKIQLSLMIRDKLEYDTEGRCTNAFQILANEEILTYAYETIKSNPGNMVRGTDKETLDGISQK